VAGAGQDISLQYDRATDESQSVEASRNFANKLWNAARFVMMNLEGKSPAVLGRPAEQDLELSDRWILSRLHQVIAYTRQNLENYALGEAAKSLYEFIWGDFCDWYIELAKPRLYAKEEHDAPSRRVAQQILAWVLEDILRLLHPFMPHITEEIWQTLTQANGEFLPSQSYPANNPDLIDETLENEFSLLIETIRTIRNLRAEAGIKPGATVRVVLQSESETELTTLAKGEAYIFKSAKVETLELTQAVDDRLKQAIAGVVGTIQVLIPLEGLVDVPALCAKLEKSLGKVEKEIQALSGRLNNPGFVNKAPADVIQSAQASLAEAQAQQVILQERLQRLQ
jgi:valyl-tRNA synthetase